MSSTLTVGGVGVGVADYSAAGYVLVRAKGVLRNK